jgi:FkbM family methyltransferase
MTEKMMPGIDGTKDFYWDANDTGLYGYYKDINTNSGPVGDWFASHKDVIQKIPSDRRNTVIQAGGAFGMYPILLSRYFKTVFTFEPDPVNYRILCKNLQHHEVDNVFESNLALTSEESKNYLALVDGDPSNRGTTRVQTHLSFINNSLAATTIDYMFEQSDKKIDLIWLDIEGHEYSALQGAVKTIRKHNPIIGVERPTNEVFDFMNRNGYIPWKNSKMDVFFVGTVGRQI